MNNPWGNGYQQESYEKFRKYGIVKKPFESEEKYIERGELRLTRKHINKAMLSMIFHIAVSGIIYLTLRLLVYVVFGEDSEFSKAYRELMGNSSFVYLVNSFYQFFSMVFPFLIVLKMFKLKVADVCSYGAPKKGTFLPTVLLGFGGCIIAGSAANQFINVLKYFGITNTGGVIDSGTSFKEVLLAGITVAIIPALFEEFAMRGILMGLLAKRTTRTAAVIISATVFGLLHGNFLQMPFAFLVGLILGFSYYITGSMWPGMLIHFINNFYSTVMDAVMANTSVLVGNLIYLCCEIAALIIGIIGYMMLSKRNKDFLKINDGECNHSTAASVKCAFTTPLFIIVAVYYILEAFGVSLL